MSNRQNICKCNICFKVHNKVIPCKQLLDWEKWINRRKEIHQKLSIALKRKPEKLLMNSADEFRRVREEQCLFEYSNVITTFDKYRGDPKFWVTPIGIKEHDGEESIYFYVPTNIQKGIIPPIEYVGTPAYIADEKGIHPRKRNMFEIWKNLTYRAERLEQIAVKKKEIEPHKPDVNDVIIIGKSIDLVCKTIEESVDEEEEEFIPLSSSIGHEVSDTPKKISFVIDDIDISSQGERKESSRKLTIFFEYIVRRRAPKRHDIKFENKGRVTMRFYFNKVEHPALFSNISTRNNDVSPFYFSKNEIIVVPGDTVYLPVCFKTHQPAIYKESWLLRTKPTLWYDEFQFIIEFHGICKTPSIERQIQLMNNFIQNQAKEFAVENVLEKIIRNIINKTKLEVIPEKYTEIQMFESANQDVNKVESIPKYHYNKKCVDQLHEFYGVVRRPEHPKSWNYSIKDLKQLAREADIIAFVEKKTSQYIDARVKRLGNLRTSIEKREIKKTSITLDLPQNPETSTIRSELKENKEGDSFSNETFYSKLQNILEELEQPSMIKNKNRMKDVNAFFITRAAFTKMSQALYDIDQSVGIQKQYPVVCKRFSVPDRLIYVTFDDSYICKTKRFVQDKTEFVCEPKSNLLVNVPLTNTEAVFKAYFCHEEDVKQTQTLNVFSQSSLHVLTVKENFNPFEEEYSDSDINSEQEISTYDLTYTEQIEFDDYRNKLVLIVQEYLLENVFALIDFLESCKEEQITNEIFRDVITCTPVEERTCVFIADKTTKKFNDIKDEETKSILDDDKNYYKSLLDIHWKRNKDVQKYYTHGLTKEKPTRETVVDDSDETKPFDLSNFCRKIFSETIDLKDTGMQTEDDYQPVNDMFSKEFFAERIASIKVSSEESSKTSSNIFYATDD